MESLHRVPPSPSVMTVLYADFLRSGRPLGLSFPQYLATIGYADPAENVAGMDDGATASRSSAGDLELISVPSQPITGKLRVKVLLIDFIDRQGTLPVSHYEQLLFSKNSHPTGSMRDYYDEVSLGKVDVTGTVHGWLRMPQAYSFYTNGESGLGENSYPRNAQRMAEDAVRAALDSGVTFQQDLAVLGGGVITALFVIHAGRGAEELHPLVRGNDIWSHKWGMLNPVDVADGLDAAIYLTVPQDCKVGISAHELGHLAFQWEDFYDPNYDEDGNEWDGSGVWDLMAGGSSNGDGNRPAHPAGLHKSQHGWIEVDEIRSSKTITLHPSSRTSGKAVKLISPSYRPSQYLFLENRSRTGFDSHLPGEGLLVWRVDESKQQFAPERPALLLIQADGRHQLETPDDLNAGDAGDPFPGTSGRTELRETGNISTSFPGGDDSGITLQNIQRDAQTDAITLDVLFEGDSLSEDGAEPTVLKEEAQPNLAIPDNDPTGVKSTIQFDQDGSIDEITVAVDILHTYIGDLKVSLVAPSGQLAVLHDRAGGGVENLKKIYRSSSNSALAALMGSQVKGRWTLQVSDVARRDTGTLAKWGLSVDLLRDETSVHGEASPNLDSLVTRPV